MINLDVLNKLGENYKLECKAAKGGVPKSIWESYSAFCNTSSGKIILGLDEKVTYIDGAKHIEYIPSNLSLDLLNEYQTTIWNILNDSNKISFNHLKNSNIYIDSVLDSNVLVIDVPEVSRLNKPVYVGKDMFKGTFKRNHEGDYHCTKEQIMQLIRDSDPKSRDSYIIEDMDISVLDNETISKYYNMFIAVKGQGHPFTKGGIPEFLRYLGAAAKINGSYHPTRAGLLMFGHEYDIKLIYPNYFLDYQDYRFPNQEGRWINRVYSSTGDWSGNILDFYLRIVNYLTEDLPVPFKMEGIYRVDVTSMHKAIREALCNTLSNCDFNESTGVVIKQYKDKIEFNNSGTFAMDIEKAMQGGQSDARNKSILALFNQIEIGERTGSGIPLIYNSTKESNYDKPTIVESDSPSTTTVTIFFNKKINNLDSNTNKLDSNENKLDSGRNNLDSNTNKLDSNENKLDFDDIKNMIKNANFRNDVRIKLLSILELFYTKEFDNEAIVLSLGTSRATAFNLIKKLLNLSLIQKTAHKGFYRFM